MRNCPLWLTVTGSSFNTCFWERRVSSPTPSQAAEIHNPICITKLQHFRAQRNMRNYPLKFFYQREMEDQRDEEAQPVGPRAGSEPRAIKYCSLREITQSTACHVCDMGALDRDKSTHWKLVEEKPRRGVPSPDDSIRTDNIQIALHQVSQRTKASSATTNVVSSSVFLTATPTALSVLSPSCFLFWGTPLLPPWKKLLVTLVSFILISEP